MDETIQTHQSAQSAQPVTSRYGWTWPEAIRTLLIGIPLIGAMVGFGINQLSANLRHELAQSFAQHERDSTAAQKSVFDSLAQSLIALEKRIAALEASCPQLYKQLDDARDTILALRDSMLLWKDNCSSKQQELRVATAELRTYIEADREAMKQLYDRLWPRQDRERLPP